MDGLENQSGRISPQQMAEVLSRLNKAMEEVQRELSAEIDASIREIKQLPSEQQEAKMKELGDSIRKQAFEKLQDSKKIESQPKSEQTDEQKKETQKLQKEAKKDLRKLMIAAEKGVPVAENRQVQRLIEKLANQNLSDQELNNIFNNIGNYLKGEEEITFSSKEGQLSKFEESVKALHATDPISAAKLVNVLVHEAAQFSQTPEDVTKKFREIVQETKSEQADYRSQEREEMFSNFTEAEKKFIAKLDDPDKFLNSIEDRTREYIKKENDPNDNHYHHLKEKFVNLYRTQNNTEPSEAELGRLIDRQVRIEVSEEIAGELSDIYNQLYKRLIVEGASKQFEEVEREDFMKGIEAVRHVIFRKLQRLENEFRDREKRNPDNPHLPKLFKMAEEEYYTEEFEYKGQSRPVPRLRPVPYFKEVNLSDYMISMQSNFIHWRERMSYLHNVRLTYGHPAHEGSFYKSLAGYAENIKGDILDQMMHLPDGKLILEAYQLYDKFLQEEYATIDWRLRPNMLMNQFEEIHTKLEKEIIGYLKLQYGDQYSDTQISHAINNAVGMARGIFLTEPETNAYADPLTAKELGLFASYGTNDAASLDVFNPLHSIMRWKGEHNLNMLYFMPMGKDHKRVWNHNEMWQNMEKYLETYYKPGSDREERNLLIDELMNITKIGGIFRRGGWRDFYQFESHYVYDGQKGDLKLLDSFKAMDIIGFEGINYFLTNIDAQPYHYHQKKYLSAAAGTAEAAQREELFQYLFERYFKPLDKNINYSSYMDGLRTKAEDNVRKKIKEGKLSISFSGKDFDKVLQAEISSLFIDGAIARTVALRFPSKFLRIDKDRFHDSGKSSWREVYEQFKSESGRQDMSRDEFDSIMKDLSFAEMLFRGEMSQKVEDMIYLTKGENFKGDIRLGDYAKYIFNPKSGENMILDENMLSKLLSKNGLDQVRVQKVLDVYKLIKNNYLTKSEFIDDKASKILKKYPYSFGVEDTDLRMIAFRGTGPRMIARSIGDIATMEEVVKGLKDLPNALRQISIDGKHDFSKILEYMLKCKGAFEGVHGVEAGQEYLYKVAGMVINFFKKDSISKPLFGLFATRELNSIAAEFAGRGSAVWEWDSRDIDSFCVALESYGILHHLPYDKSKGPIYEDKYLNIFGKKIKFGKQLVKAYEFNGQKLRKELGGDWKAILFDMANNIIPFAMLFILWQYMKKSLEEVEGKKK